MKERYILTIDVGTQSTRGIIFDEEGNIIIKEKREYNPYFSEFPGHAEQDALLYWDNICNICRNLKYKNSRVFNEIIGITITTMRNTVVLVDHEGIPLRPAILWLDQRRAVKDEKLPFPYNLAVKAVKEEEMIRNFKKAFRWQWVKENEKEISEKTFKYLMLSAYLNFKMTGRFIDSSASQIGYIPFDFKRGKWASGNDIKKFVFNIDKEKLPILVTPGTLIGAINKDAAGETGLSEGIPVIATGSDKGCETLGTGCLNSHTGNISLGSAVTIQTMIDKYIEIHPFFPSYPSVMPGKYNPEVQINRGYWMVRWFKNEFAEKEMQESMKKDIPVEVLLNNLLENVSPGSDGLLLQPYWGGELKDPLAKGAVIGFTEIHTRAHLYRAIIEGINFAVLHGIESIEKKTGRRMKYLAISGGGSQSDNICQITADMMGRNVYRVQTFETSGLGAAVAGFKALGIFETYEDAVNHMVFRQASFQPNHTNTIIYKKLYSVYKKIYPNLKKLYSEIDSIIKK